MTSTILYSPSNQQLEELSKENPEVYANLKTKMLAELGKHCFTHIEHRISSRSSQIYSKLADEVEAKLFKKSGGSYNYSYEFEDGIKKKITEKIETHLADTIDKEYTDYLNSPEFKALLKSELKKRAGNEIVRTLDQEIGVQAQKFIKV